MEKAAESTNDSLAKSTFLVGFLAALIGMAAFKDELSALHIPLFQWNISLLFLAAPMIGMMLFAAYIGALAHFLSNINGIKVPVSKYLNIISTATTILSLLYPLVVLLLFVFSTIALSVKIDHATTQTIFAIVIAIVGVSTIAMSLAVSNWLFSVRSIDELARLSLRIDIFTNEDRPSSNKFLSQYEQLVYFLEAFVKIKGYGTNGQRLAALAQNLHKMTIYTPQDVQQAQELNKLRDAFVSGKSIPSVKESAQAIKTIHTLYSKAERAVKLQQTGAK